MTLLARGTHAEPLPLSAALQHVRVVAPQIHAARERLAAARGLVDQAERRPNPQLEIREENLTFDSHGPIARDPSIDFFATLGQAIELGGKRGERVAIASADLRTAEADQQRVERELLIETARHYLAALQAREHLHTTQEASDEFDALVVTMEKRVRDGLAAEADLMKLRSESARFRTVLAQLRIDEHRHGAALAALLGEEGPVAGERLSIPTSLLPPEGTRQDLLSSALEQNPELRAANARVERADHELALEQARRIPDPILTAGYKRTSGVDTAVTGLTVPLPIFDNNQGNVTRAAAEARAAAFDRDALRRRWTAEIDTLLTTAIELAERAQRVEADLLNPAMIVRKAARSAFREGGSNILQLVDAERVFSDAQRTAITTIVDAHGAALAARLACGQEPWP